MNLYISTILEKGNPSLAETGRVSQSDVTSTKDRLSNDMYVVYYFLYY